MLFHNIFPPWEMTVLETISSRFVPEFSSNAGKTYRKTAQRNGIACHWRLHPYYSVTFSQHDSEWDISPKQKKDFYKKHNNIQIEVSVSYCFIHIINSKLELSILAARINITRRICAWTWASFLAYPAVNARKSTWLNLSCLLSIVLQL